MNELLLERRKGLVSEARKIGKAIRKIDFTLINNKEPSRHPGTRWNPPTEKDAAKIDLAIDIVCDVFNIDEVSLLSPSRKREYVKPRQCLFYIASMSCACSLHAIGVILGTHRVGGFDHATIIYGRKSVEEALYMKNKRDVDPDGYAGLVEKCIAIFMDKKQEL